MKLATSTGDFSWYVDSIAEKIRAFAGLGFKYINLEQGVLTEENWQRTAHSWGEAAAETGLKLVVAHAPCLHHPCLGALNNPDDEEYRENIAAIRRSIEVCHLLDLPRIVVHACPHPSFDKATFYRYNTMFYREFFDLMEKYHITVMTENWDNEGHLP